MLRYPVESAPLAKIPRMVWGEKTIKLETDPRPSVKALVTDKRCPNCGKPVIRAKSHAIYCSRRCAKVDHQRRQREEQRAARQD